MLTHNNYPCQKVPNHNIIAYKKVSQCCNFSVRPVEEDYFAILNRDDECLCHFSFKYKCNKCGNYCNIKDIQYEEG